MNHWYYIAIAYGAFGVLMAWDLLAPRRSLHRAIRSIRLHQRRKDMP